MTKRGRCSICHKERKLVRGLCKRCRREKLQVPVEVKKETTEELIARLKGMMK